MRNGTRSDNRKEGAKHMRGSIFGWRALALCGLLLGAAAARPAGAQAASPFHTTYYVPCGDVTSDNASLVNTINLANNDTKSTSYQDIIYLGTNATPCSYTLTGTNGTAGIGLPPITGNIVISHATSSGSVVFDWANIQRSTASGTPNFTLFEVATGGRLELHSVFLQNGNSPYYAGAIWNDGGTLVVDNSDFAGNISTGGAGGGAILASGGSTTIHDSLFEGSNSATYGSALSEGLGSSVSIDDSTLVGDGNAAHDVIDDTAGNLTLQNVTINGQGSTGLGTGQDTIATLNNVTIANTNYGIDAEFGSVSATNTLIVGAGCKIVSGTIAGSHNLAGGSCGSAFTVNSRPLVAAFANYGYAPTETYDSSLVKDYVPDLQTYSLLPGSPAIGSGSGCYTSQDERHAGRTRWGTSYCDIGAFQSGVFTLSVTGGGNQTAATGTSFGWPLTVSVTGSQWESGLTAPVNGGTVTFAAPASGAGATLFGSPATVITGTATITATANGTAGTYLVSATTAGGFSSTGAVSVTAPLTNTAVSMVNDTSSAITYTGSGWHSSGNRGVGDYQNDEHYTITNNDFFTYTFTGTGISVVGEKNNGGGNDSVYLDGTLQYTINTYNASRLAQQVLYGVTGLTNGSHTVKIVKTSGSYFELDALEVQQIPLVNDTAPGFAYTGSWSYSSSRTTNDYQRDEHYTTTNGSAVTYTFTGTGISLLGEKNSGGGTNSVYLDGSLLYTVSTVNSSTLAQQVLFGVTGLSARAHTLQLVKQSGGYLEVDAVAIQ